MSMQDSWQAMTPGAPGSSGGPDSDGGEPSARDSADESLPNAYATTSDSEWQPGGNELDEAFGMEQPGNGKRKLNESIVLLAIVLVVAAGALFAMRKGGSAKIDQSITDVELKIEAALAQLVVGTQPDMTDAAGNAVLRADTDSVIARFTADPSTQQVPIDGVRKNPFALFGSATVAAAPSPAIKPVLSMADRQRELRARQLRTELDALELQTVMNGRTPMAVISGKVVRPRDQIGSFTVAAIESMTVMLTADGNSYRLAMNQPDLHEN